VRVTAPPRVAFGRDQHMLAERGQMMTTKRTAIRRRLAIRRTANRPPWRGRQTRHDSIVAPLAATLAATVAVGVGVALARVERERREARERRSRERRFGLLAHERVGDGLRRIALAQLDIAIEALRQDGAGRSPEQHVHEARKALKRLRALLRLLRARLGETAYERDSAALRDAGQRLAQARDAAVLHDTLKALLARHPRKLAKRSGVRRLRAQLQAERDGAAAHALSDGSTRSAALEQLCALRVRVSHWELSDASGVEALEPALGELYGKGRRRMRRARAAKRDESGRKLHEWRKRVKDLRYAAELVQREVAGKRLRDPLGVKPRKRKRKRESRLVRKQAERLRMIAKRADELGELLGEEHDLAVLAERVRTEGGPSAAATLGKRSRKALLQAIAKRRARLRKRALRDGERLYGRGRKQFVARVRRAAALEDALSRR
jgi:CHAD domain-containing protein